MHNSFFLPNSAAIALAYMPDKELPRHRGAPAPEAPSCHSAALALAYAPDKKLPRRRGARAPQAPAANIAWISASIFLPCSA